MPIAIATTTVTIKGKRPQSALDPDAEGYDPATPPRWGAGYGVRASITLPSGLRPAVVDQTDKYTLRIDPVDVGLTRFDQVIDESNGVEYAVVWALPSLPVDFGLEHIKAEIQIARGLNSGGESNEFA